MILQVDTVPTTGKPQDMFTRFKYYQIPHSVTYNFHENTGNIQIQDNKFLSL
jgi:hypothetical protein